jgi:hypothetical protein
MHAPLGVVLVKGIKEWLVDPGDLRVKKYTLKNR